MIDIKKTKAAIKVFIVFFVFSLIAVTSIGNVRAIGMMSKPIVRENVLRGQVLEEELEVLNNEKMSHKFELEASGDIKKWVTFESDGGETQTITVPSTTKEVVGVRIKVPNDAPNKDYKGTLSIKIAPDDKKNESEEPYTRVKQRISREVYIKVTDKEIIDLNASASPEKYVIEKDKPLILNALYYNNGNIKLRPKLSLKVKKDDEVIYNSIYPYPEEAESVKPFNQKEITAKYYPGEVKEGKLRGEVSVVLDDKEKDLGGFTFEIIDSDKPFYKDSFKLFIVGSSIIGGLILALGLFILNRKKHLTKLIKTYALEKFKIKKI